MCWSIKPFKNIIIEIEIKVVDTSPTLSRSKRYSSSPAVAALGINCYFSGFFCVKDEEKYRTKETFFFPCVESVPPKLLVPEHQEVQHNRWPPGGPHWFCMNNGMNNLCSIHPV